MVGFRGSLELGSVTEWECEALLSRLTRYEIPLMEKDHMCRDQSSATKIAGYFSSEGVATVT